MASFIGQAVGGILAIYLLSLLVEWALIKRVMDDSVVGCWVSVGVAYALAVLIYGFGNADGGPWNPGRGFYVYAIGAVVVGVLRSRRRLRDLRELEEV